MATGTGKTFTAFQIIHRLHKSGAKKKILYLADRNVLIDQTMQNDFKPFQKVMTKVEHRNMDSSYEIYMSLYHQLRSNEEEIYKQFNNYSLKSKPHEYLNSHIRGSRSQNSKLNLFSYHCPDS